MARIRTIKPEFWTDEDMVSVPRDLRLFRIAAWNFEDDNGVHELAPLTLKLKIFPGDIDITPETIEAWVVELEKLKKFKIYTVKGKRYFQDLGFTSHQYIDRPRKSKLPTFIRNHMKSHEIIVGREGKGRERKGKERSTDSPEPNAASGPAPVLIFPIVGQSKTWGIGKEKMAEYESTFPALDVPGECKKALCWLNDNPARRKTVNGMTRFLFSWLCRAQDGNGIRKGSGQYAGFSKPKIDRGASSPDYGKFGRPDDNKNQ